MNEHTTGVFHPTHYDGYVARCSCGWSSEEMGSESAAAALSQAHEREGRRVDELEGAIAKAIFLLEASHLTRALRVLAAACPPPEEEK